jgi:hypothetical protein
MANPVSIFISYSRKDSELKDQLLEHLSSLRQDDTVTVWHDRQIEAGDAWSSAIDTHLELADIILLLVSPGFLASEYCYGTELKRALQRQSEGSARTIPVLLRPVDWGHSGLKHIQALPSDGRPVTLWPNRDEAFHNIALGIRSVVELSSSPISDFVVHQSQGPKARAAPPKYYLYISDQKVDMLFPQVPVSIRMQTGTRFGITDGKPLKEYSDLDRAGNRIFKLDAVLEFLRETGQIGTIDDPKAYFSGSGQIEWGYTHAFGNRPKPFAYFTGETEGTAFLLSASSKYLADGPRGKQSGFSSSSVPHVIDSLIKEIESNGTVPSTLDASKLISDHEKKDLPFTGNSLALDLVDTISGHLMAASQPLEFAAKTLLRGVSPRYGRKINILGSPLYVALAL